MREVRINPHITICDSSDYPIVHLSQDDNGDQLLLWDSSIDREDGIYIDLTFIPEFIKQVIYIAHSIDPNMDFSEVLE